MKKIVLLGNPNTGKTTLFNALTSSNEHTGNWNGVTVDVKSKSFVYENEKYEVIDLPGVYSLSPFSDEENVTLNYLLNNKDAVVVNILDINNIQRNLYLTTELLELGYKSILIINNNICKDCNFVIDEKKLQKELGVDVLKLNIKNKEDIYKLKQKLQVLLDKKECEQKISYNSKIDSLIKEIKAINKINNNFYALKCLEQDKTIISKLKFNELELRQLKDFQSKTSMEEIITARHNKVSEILNKIGANTPKKSYGKSKLDKYVLNKYLSLPIFVAMLLCVFYFTFFSFGATISSSLSNFIKNVIGNNLLGLIKNITSNLVVLGFFETAIIGGLTSIMSFLPQVVILYVCLGVIEQSGYLSRIAFSLDDLFSKVGLSGRGVYTLLMGFGCSASACLTCRTIEDKNSKIKTAMLAPYMSCSAKLPIYSVIGSAFFGASNVFIIFLLYLLGVVVALGLSVFYEKTFLKSKEQSFILEFTPYKMIGLKQIIALILQNIKTFVVRFATLLLSVNIIVWILSSFSFGFVYVKDVGGISMLQSIGKIIAPIFTPLGFNNWGACSALVSGLIAKEIIVSTITIINNVYASNIGLGEHISKSLTNPLSLICFTPASAISYMVFCLLYSPCFATISVLSKEVGKKWTAISIVVQLAVAYIISMIIYLSTSLILNKGLITFLLCVLVVGLITISVFIFCKKFFGKNKCKYCTRK